MFLPVLQTWLPQVWGKFYSLQNPTPRCMGVGVSCNILDTVVYEHHITADYSRLIARCGSHNYIGRCCAMNVTVTIMCYNMWLMEGHCGRHYNNMCWVSGRCYCQCDRWNSGMYYCRCCCHCGRWIGQIGWIIYFILSSEMLNRISSYMWSRWYLPMFLLRDGLLTLVYIASFMSLMRFWSSLPTLLKFSNVVVWPVLLKWSYIGDGGFWCSLNLTQMFLRILLYILHHIWKWHHSS